MTRPYLLAIAAFLAVCSTQAQAQDLLGSANSATRSYSFAEIKYLPELDSNLPIWLEVVYEVRDQWSVWAQYRKQKFENVGPELSAETGLQFPADTTVEGTQASLGFLYHDEFTQLPDTDWVAGLRRGNLDAEVDIEGLVIPVDEDYWEGYVGLRRSFSARTEAEAGIVIDKPDDGSSITTGSLKLVYRVKPSIDIAFSLDQISEDEELAIGFRYTW